MNEFKPDDIVKYKGDEYVYGYAAVNANSVIYRNGERNFQDGILVATADLQMSKPAVLVEGTMSTRNQTAAEVYKKVRRGDPIKDGELAVAIEVFKEFTDLAFLMGRRFDLYALELNSTVTTLEGFRDFRRKT